MKRPSALRRKRRCAVAEARGRRHGFSLPRTRRCRGDRAKRRARRAGRLLPLRQGDAASRAVESSAIASRTPRPNWPARRCSSRATIFLDRHRSGRLTADSFPPSAVHSLSRRHLTRGPVVSIWRAQTAEGYHEAWRARGAPGEARPAAQRNLFRMKVVIVESPAKAKTINKYLGKDYDVYASFGHVRDLDGQGRLGRSRQRLRHALGGRRQGRQAAQRHRRRRQGRRPRHPRHRPRPRGRGDLLAHPTKSSRARSCSKDKRGRPRRVQRRHQGGGAGGDAPSARDRRGAGRRLSRPPRARLSRRLQPVAGAVAQAAGRALGGARAVGGAAHRLRPRARNREIRRRANIGRSSPTCATAAERAFTARLVGADGKKIGRLDVGSGDEAEAFKAALEKREFTVASVEGEAGQAPPLPAFHHLDPAAGGLAQARPRAGAHHADRAAALRRRRHRRRGGRPHHLYAHRRRRPRARGGRAARAA